MSQTNLETSGSIPSLLHELCNHVAKNDRALSAHLYKIVLKFLTMSNKEDSVHDQYVVTKIRKHLAASKSDDDVKSFDLLYSKLQAMPVIKNKSSMLQLFYELAQVGHKDAAKWALNDCELPEVNRNRSTSSYTFLPENSKSGNVRKIYSVNQVSSDHSAHSLAWSNSDHDMQIYKASSSSQCSSRSSHSEQNYTMISETNLMQQVIYCFQGIEGKVLRKEPGGLGFSVDLKIAKNMTPIQRGLVERLSNVGFLHNQIKQHCEEPDKHIGLIGQSLVSILKDELTSYYHLVSMLQTQLSKDGSNRRSELTLRRMTVWVAEPQLRLQWLAYIAEECNEKKGGALISAVHHFLQHGSTCAQQVSSKVLSAVCRPLYVMLSKWLLNGELQDPCGEFFIEIRSITKHSAERLWHDKYHIRKAMIPSFITMDQARKILATGKSINFLRQVCQDNEELPGREALQKLFATTTAEALFSTEQSIDLHEALENAYKETSLRVLNLLKEKYNMLEHMQALRRYLLLGQGDFIRHLLELVAPELNKPGDQVYSYTMTTILETAVHVTNAQYDDDDILKRLNIEVVLPSKQDVGWDVFALTYAIDGPIGTIFQPVMQIYKSLFGVLWNAKRMEYILSNLRKQQIANAKLFRKMTELQPVTHMLHVCTSEMIHFLHQTQYYFLFEVLECSWDEMMGRVNQAECLDDVISAHNAFLKSIQTGMLLDPASYELSLNLRSIFNTIIQFEVTQEHLFSLALRERDSRLKFAAKHKKLPESEMLSADREENVLRTKKFCEFLGTVKKQIKTISVVYNMHVVKYLKALATNADLNLQLLSVRLNFNDYYKIM